MDVVISVIISKFTTENTVLSELVSPWDTWLKDTEQLDVQPEVFS